MNDTTMWLLPLPIVTVLLLLMTYRAGWRWTWGACLQQLLILLVTLSALYFVYAPSSLALPGNIYAANCLTAVAWSLFLAFNVGQRLAVNALTLDLSLLRVDDARARLPMIYALCWGPPAEYWTDMVQALALFQIGNDGEANAIFDRWRSDARMPPGNKDGMLVYSLFGRIMHHDWHGIIEAFLACRRGERTGVPFVPLELAARAFLEEQKFDESFRCLRAVLEQAARITPSGIDMMFLPFFALSGAKDKLDILLSRCTNKRSVPAYSRLLWLGRCAAANGDYEKALKLLAEARDKTPAELTVWHERIGNSIDAVHRSVDGESLGKADQTLVDEAWRTYSRWRLSADMMRPVKIGPGLAIMMVALVVAFIPANLYTDLHAFLPIDRSYLGWEKFILQHGQLDENFWKGQWWRSISYMFLHGNTSHLMLNVGALYLFGRIAERMYGTAKFFLIFFASGMLSGVFQLLITPHDPAVGASGAIFGVFGAASAGLVKLKSLLPPHLRKAELKFMLIIALLQVGCDQALNKFAEATDKSPNAMRIAAFAHLGGMVAGFIIGMLLPLRKLDSAETVDIGGRSG